MDTSLVLPDFDALVALNQKDPVAYAIFRRNFLQECVGEAPDQYQPMLDDLVWRMDAVRQAASSPHEAAAAAMSMMMDSVGQMRVQLLALQDANAEWSTQVFIAKLLLQMPTYGYSVGRSK